MLIEIPALLRHCQFHLSGKHKDLNKGVAGEILLYTLIVITTVFLPSYIHLVYHNSHHFSTATHQRDSKTSTSLLSKLAGAFSLKVSMTNTLSKQTSTTYRPDCVTEVRMGNTILTVSGYFKRDATGHRRRQNGESPGGRDSLPAAPRP